MTWFQRNTGRVYLEGGRWLVEFMGRRQPGDWPSKGMALVYLDTLRRRPGLAA